MRTAVVGGGVIGLSVAWTLARRGHEVIAIERGDFGQEASWAAAGMLAPRLEAEHDDPLLPLALFSQNAYPDFVARLEAESGLRVGFAKNGAFLLRHEAAALDAAEDKLGYLAALPGAPQRIDAGALARHFPELAHFPGALYFPEEAQLEPRALLRALLEACRRARVRLEPHCAVTELATEQGHLRALVTGHGRLPIDHAVLAAGAWSSQLGGSPVRGVKPIRGQMLEFCGPQGARPFFWAEGVYVLSRGDGRWVVGSTMEDVGFSRGTTPEALALLTERAGAALPWLRGAKPTAAWDGLRPARARLALGRTEVEGLWTATGHFRNGILLAPATAAVLAAAIEDRPAPLDVSAFSACPL